MSDTDGEIALADAVGGVAVYLYLAGIEALDCCAVEWIAVGENLKNQILALRPSQMVLNWRIHTPTTFDLAASLA
jgi:hypothetical protein